MTVGVVMLVHTALDRAEQVIRHWVAGGCPVVVHVDKNVGDRTYNAFVGNLCDLPDVKFSKRHQCEWGMWGLVAATQDASELMLRTFPKVRHVYLASGSCLPLRPIKEFRRYLDSRPRTDFIESATTSEVPWTVGGLDAERFTMRFPVSWKRNRYLFDRFVEIQRALRLKRRMPNGITPHMGSQWWCLSRRTLSAILQDPDRKTYDRFFRHVWIPDESYFQTMARRHTRNLVNSSLTHSRFDWKGRPHVLYDDHLEALCKTDAFFARKAWSGADALYKRFASDQVQPSFHQIDTEAPDLWGLARQISVSGRPGLLNAGRFPWWGYQGALTAHPYVVFSGFDDLFENFNEWLKEYFPDLVAHGRLFDAESAKFEANQPVYAGGLSSSSALRDYNPEGFLSNLVRARPDAHQALHVSPSDPADIWPLITRDRNATIFSVRGAFFRPLAEIGGPQSRVIAARQQAREEIAISFASSPECRANSFSWDLSEVMADPVTAIRGVLAGMGADVPAVIEMPKMKPVEKLDHFLTELANSGVTPRVAGEIHAKRSHSDLTSRFRVNG